jgi:ribosomal protein L37AE/L43A
MVDIFRALDGGWQEVWECPKCGQQIAGGEHSAGAGTIRFNNLRCSNGHAPTEMEQKLSQAMPFQPEDL